jgi:hypothetical protein
MYQTEIDGFCENQECCGCKISKSLTWPIPKLYIPLISHSIYILLYPIASNIAIWGPIPHFWRNLKKGATLACYGQSQLCEFQRQKEKCCDLDTLRPTKWLANEARKCDFIHGYYIQCWIYGCFNFMAIDLNGYSTQQNLILNGIYDTSK